MARNGARLGVADLFTLLPVMPSAYDLSGATVSDIWQSPFAAGRLYFVGRWWRMRLYSCQIRPITITSNTVSTIRPNPCV